MRFIYALYLRGYCNLTNTMQKLLFFSLLAAFILTACNKNDNPLPPNAEEYFTIEFRRKNQALVIPADSVAAVRIGNLLEVYVQSSSTGDVVQGFVTSAQAQGFYDADFTFNIDNIQYTSDPDFKTQITQYGNSGEFVIGFYNGMVEDPSGNGYVIKGQYKIRLN